MLIYEGMVLIGMKYLPDHPVTFEMTRVFEALQKLLVD